PAGERLLQFEHQLRQTQNVDHCLLVSKSEPPLELTFLIFYLWGDIGYKQVQGAVIPQDLDLPPEESTALTAEKPAEEQPEADKQVIVRWGASPVSLRNLVNAGFVLKPVAAPEVYKQQELQADLITKAPPGF
ncbi:MAG TPA: hypothetical protein DCL95_15720, partial [Rhodospirillaceae bacterium]|nr:hypothetical protein [Rhodospirillaceae bacterium]